MSSSLFDLTGRVAIVTGGNGGIGLGMATGLAEAGAAIVIAARDQKKSAEAAEKLQKLGARVATVEVDVKDQDSVKRMVQATLDRFQRVDILVANAGVNIRKPPQDMSVEEWQAVLDVNLNGPFFCAQAVYPAMKAQGGGKIITIGSMTSIFGVPFAPAYSATKGGVVQLTRSLATAWAKDNIQVNCAAGLDRHRPHAAGAQAGARLARADRGAHAGRALGRSEGLRRHRRIPRKPRLKLHYRRSHSC